MIALLTALPAQAASEAQCRQAFTEWMLAQHKQFSDRKASKMERRSAERAIDQVRSEFSKRRASVRLWSGWSTTGIRIPLHPADRGDPRLHPAGRLAVMKKAPNLRRGFSGHDRYRYQST